MGDDTAALEHALRGIRSSYREDCAGRLAGAFALDPLPNTMLSPKTKPKLSQVPLLCTS
jgi:hypothetical protein